MNNDKTAIPVAAVAELVQGFREEVSLIWRRMPPLGTAWYTLVIAYCERMDRFCQDAERGKDPDCGDELIELRSWLFASEDRDGAFADMLVKHGLSYTETTAALNRAGTEERGAPASRRKLFVDGFDLHARGQSYQQIADRLCDCDKRIHDAHCRENFRKGIKSVERLISKYASPTSPTPGN
jgi:hypothetical protein